MKNNTFKKRKLTIKEVYQGRTYGYKAVSCICLTGVWLQNAGFPIGGSVTVAVTPKQLVITLDDKPVTPPNLERRENKIRMFEIGRALIS
jgi:hypothetical protein